MEFIESFGHRATKAPKNEAAAQEFKQRASVRSILTTSCKRMFQGVARTLLHIVY